MNTLDTYQSALGLVARCSKTDNGTLERALSAIASASAYRPVIRKKSDGIRITYNPCQELKQVQSGLLKTLFYRFPVAECQFGYVTSRSVVDCANFHIWTLGDYNVWKPTYPRWMLRLDLKDAFPSVTAGVLEGLYRKLLSHEKLIGYKHWSPNQAGEVYEIFISLLVLLTTHQGRMPQGAPTSPYLLNLVLLHTGVIDRVKVVCQKFDRDSSRLRLSIYADDFIFSSRKAKISDRTIGRLIEAIEEGGIFKVNLAKTRRNARKYKAHIINGVVIGEVNKRPSLTLPQAYLNSLRGRMHRLRLALTNFCDAPQEASPQTFPRLSEFLDLKELGQVRSQIGWVRSVYRKADNQIPSVIRKELEAFEQAVNRSRYIKRRQRDQHNRELQSFLREQFGKSNTPTATQ